MWLACFATVEIEIRSQGNLPKTVQSGYTVSVPVSGGVIAEHPGIPHSWLVSTKSCSNLKKGQTVDVEALQGLLPPLILRL